MTRLPGPCALLAALLSAQAAAGEVSVAVAANFAAPMREIAAAFERETGHRATLSLGSTGKFHSQIVNGAPFEVLLAADEATPARLEREGHAVEGSRFTYAVGRLVLWSREAGFVDPQGQVLERGDYTRLAIANPQLAPYGKAAIQVLERLGLRERLAPRLVQGDNVAQAYQFVATGNARLGFVALAQVRKDGRIAEGSAWVVPAALHAPIRQDAVLLAAGRNDPAARALLAYLRGEAARAIVRAYGYES